MSNYKLTFKLKQHTPIIHFQYDQTGATLRATELKPKLDRFLIDKIKLTETKKIDGKQKEVPKPEYESWFINEGKEHLALDYKVRVVSNNEASYFLPLPMKLNSRRYPDREETLKRRISQELSKEISYIAPSPFFANADKIKFSGNNLTECKCDELIFAIYTKNIHGTITTFKSNLLKEIENSLEDFFLTHNFGTRQNKGFGNFTVKEINGNTKNITIAQLQKHFIKESNNSYTSFNDIFKFILNEYNLLKSGINIPGRNPRYEKSELFKYFIKKGIRWEKRFIKQQLIANRKQLKKTHDPIDYDDTKTPIDVNNDNNYYNSVNDNQTNNYAYIRALLGLAEHFEYQLDPSGRLKVKIVSTNNNKIERFQSPIFFKVIDNTVYLGINDSYKQIEGEEFEFFDDRISLGKLKIPTGFDLNNFITNHISTKWKNI